ncbi:hypothetical protein FNV43_RR22594 [Rhamnella rubrinervis]|uniref:Uncharacterized protein n=1 Tax=Rhamnella rubrinervis TaxID=2594499 RepID=A0A8K0GVC1_9ROSA|nr:hypothetical protein FNV43_RR22594 [Rhamnella rubrinervis]
MDHGRKQSADKAGAARIVGSNQDRIDQARDFGPPNRKSMIFTYWNSWGFGVERVRWWSHHPALMSVTLGGLGLEVCYCDLSRSFLYLGHSVITTLLLSAKRNEGQRPFRFDLCIRFQQGFQTPVGIFGMADSECFPWRIRWWLVNAVGLLVLLGFRGETGAAGGQSNSVPIRGVRDGSAWHHCSPALLRSGGFVRVEASFVGRQSQAGLVFCGFEAYQSMVVQLDW